MSWSLFLSPTQAPEYKMITDASSAGIALAAALSEIERLKELLFESNRTLRDLEERNRRLEDISCRQQNDLTQAKEDLVQLRAELAEKDRRDEDEALEARNERDIDQ
jgi:Skp family chaperone for outer membrane proteins